jgi:hypothetical protein
MFPIYKTNQKPREYRVLKNVKGRLIECDGKYYQPQSEIFVTEHIVPYSDKFYPESYSINVSIDGEVFRIYLESSWTTFSLACFIADNLPEPVSASELRMFGFRSDRQKVKS